MLGVVTLQAQVAEQETVITESSIPAEDLYIDDIVRKRLIVDNRVLPYDHVREADIAWQTKIWRIVDTREKTNLVFRYPEKPFFSIIRELAENGDIALFKDEKFSEILSPEELDNILFSVDTSTYFDYDEYVEKVKVVKNEINWEDIKRYRLKEVWFFDEESSRMKVRILGIAPEKDEYDDLTGELKYSLPLFYIYYPEARQYLGKYRVFNEFNDVAPMAWSDLFESRFFTSYIYKKSNVNDLTLKMMYEGYDRAGIDRLLESDKIKQELFNFEHDLWSY
ncbi:MAG: gliding motility protein GldN [Saprospiraceae bacterium]|nr:gliding motility protein GldN [Saprospiraceae bacterium]